MPWLAFTTLRDFLTAGSTVLQERSLVLPRRNHKSGSNSNAVAWRDSHRGIKQKVVTQASQVNALKVRRRKLIRGGPDYPGAFKVPLRGTAVLLVGTVLVPCFVFLFYTTSAPTSSLAYGMADQYVAVKKPVSSTPSPL